MPQVFFTPNLQRHISCPPQRVNGATVMSALESVFAANPELRDYILDEQGQLRQHIAVFVDGQFVIDRLGLSDAINEQAEVYVMQALSGG